MSKLFGGGSASKPQPPTRMPDTQDPAVVEAQSAELRRIQARSGRTSTKLSSGGNTGQAYSNSLLGQS